MTDKKKILISDDDLDILEQLTLVLKEDGYEVFAAASQKETEELLLSVQPDLAILDLMMEQMDSGLVLCNQLKKLYPETPIIMLTAVKASTGLSFAARSDDEKSWIKADLLLDKPIRPERLRADVRRLLQIPVAAHH